MIKVYGAQDAFQVPRFDFLPLEVQATYKFKACRIKELGKKKAFVNFAFVFMTQAPYLMLVPSDLCQFVLEEHGGKYFKGGTQRRIKLCEGFSIPIPGAPRDLIKQPLRYSLRSLRKERKLAKVVFYVDSIKREIFFAFPSIDEVESYLRERDEKGSLLDRFVAFFLQYRMAAAGTFLSYLAFVGFIYLIGKYIVF